MTPVDTSAVSSLIECPMLIVGGYELVPLDNDCGGCMQFSSLVPPNAEEMK